MPSPVMRAIMSIMKKTTSGTTYATWNPSDKGTNVTLSGGDLSGTTVIGGGFARSTIGKSSGKWYWEVLCQSSGGSFGLLGIEQARPASGYPGGAAGVGYVYQTDGQKGNGAVFSAYGASYTTNDVVGVAFDAGGLTIIPNTFNINDRSKIQCYDIQRGIFSKIIRNYVDYCSHWRSFIGGLFCLFVQDI